MLYIRSSNSFGMPLEVDFTTFEARSDINSPYVVPITGLVPWSIDASTQIGQSDTSKLVISKSTPTNIDDAFNYPCRKHISIND